MEDWRTQAADAFMGGLNEFSSNVNNAFWEFSEQAQNTQLQTVFLQAQREVQRKKAALLAKFETALHQALATLPAGARRSEQALEDDVELSLLNLDLHEKNIALQTIAQRSEKQNQYLLYALSQRLSAINHGLPIAIEQIPCSPKQLTDIINHCVDDLEMEHEALLVLYTLFDKFVMAKAPKAYEDLNQRLIEAGILPNLKYRVKGLAGGSHPPMGQAASDPHGRKEEALASISSHADFLDHGPAYGKSQLTDELLVRIHSLLRHSRKQHVITAPLSSREIIETVDQVNIPESMPLPAEIALSLKDLVIVDKMLLKRVRTVLTRQRENLKTHIGPERLPEQHENTIDIVGMLFEQMLSDERIPDTAKALLSHLHTPYIKIALKDGKFLSDPAHPARRLFDQMIDAACQWVDETEIQLGAYPLLKQIVDSLVKTKEIPIPLIESHQHELQDFASRLRNRTKLLEKRTLASEQGRAQLDRAKDLALQSIGKTFSGKMLTHPCKAFVTSTWTDYLTLVALRCHLDQESAAWKDAEFLGREILRINQSAIAGTTSPAAIGEFSLKIKRDVEGLIPHQSPQLGKFLQSLYKNAIKAPTEKITSHKRKDEGKPVALSPQAVPIIASLRAAPPGTLFLFNKGKDGLPQRLKLSWFNPHSNHLLFVDNNGKKAKLTTVERVAQEIINGQVVILEDRKSGFISWALNSIRKMLEAVRPDQADDAPGPEKGK